jgi:hypothetical protein
MGNKLGWRTAHLHSSARADQLLPALPFPLSVKVGNFEGTSAIVLQDFNMSSQGF